MIFFSLMCLVLAAYFLWDALRDKTKMEASNTVTSTHAAASKPTIDGAVLDTTIQATAKEPVNQRGLSSRASAPDAANDSANDANVKSGLTAAALATAGVTAAAVSTTASNAYVSNKSAVSTTDSSTGIPTKGDLRFLEGPIGRKDDLTRIDGVGPVIEEGLNDLGIFHYHQMANFTATDIENVDAELDFPGRITRENWVEQARKLSSINVEQSTLGNADDLLDSVVSIDRDSPSFSAIESVLTEADYTGIWNTDVLIEIQERLKILNTRASDAPRLRISVNEYDAIKTSDDAQFSRERLLEILDRLRELD